MGRLDGILEQGVVKRWSRLAEEAERMDPAALHAAGQRARRLARQLQRILSASDARARPCREVPKPLHADWAWRPDLWSAPLAPGGVAALASGMSLGRDVKVFHDCPRRECSVRQMPGDGAQAGAAYGLSIEVYHFEGKFLSLAIDLPPEALDGLSRRHLVRLSADCDLERPLSAYCRLNVRHGPNVAQVVRALEGEDHVDLDLAASDLDEERINAAWVDLIFEAPAMNRIVLGDVTLSRRPRAEF